MSRNAVIAIVCVIALIALAGLLSLAGMMGGGMMGTMMCSM